MNEEEIKGEIPPKMQYPELSTSTESSETVPGRIALGSPFYSEGARREKEGHDTLRILYDCYDGKWNHARVIEALGKLDQLVSEGWTVYAYDRDIIEKCRKRCENDNRADDFERRWDKRCRELSRAVKKKDVDAIKTLLASPEFRKRDPDEFLLERAESMLDDETSIKRKFNAIIIGAAIVGIAWLLWTSAQNSKQKAFDERCREEVSKLNSLLESFNPIAQLTYELDYLQSDAPDVFADPRVQDFNERLKTLVTDNQARTNEIASLLVELERLEADNWRQADGETIGKIERVDKLLQPHDTSYAKRILVIKNSVIARSKAKKEGQRLLAEQYCGKLVSVLDSLSMRLRKDLADENIPNLIKKGNDAIEKWQTTYAAHAPDLEPQAERASAAFSVAQKVRSNALRALGNLASASRAVDIMDARTELVENFSSYATIAALPPLPYSTEDVLAILSQGVRTRIFFAEDAKDRFSGKDIYSAEKDGNCKIEVQSAGKVKFDPLNAAYKLNNKVVLLGVNGDVPLDSPVYILRKSAGKLTLKRAIVAPKGKWGVVSHAIMDELVAGEPLFWVKVTEK